MSAEIIQFIPKPNLNRDRMQRELEKEAAKILESVPFGGAGIDGMYLAPEKDPA